MSKEDNQVEEIIAQTYKDKAFYSGLDKGVYETTPFGLIRHPDTCPGPEPGLENSYNSGRKWGRAAALAVDATAATVLLYILNMAIKNL